MSGHSGLRARTYQSHRQEPGIGNEEKPYVSHYENGIGHLSLRGRVPIQNIRRKNSQSFDDDIYNELHGGERTVKCGYVFTRKGVFSKAGVRRLVLTDRGLKVLVM